MADPHIRTEEPPAAQTPLLVTNQTRKEEDKQEEEEEESLDKTLQRLETFLCFLGFNQSSVLSFVLSWTVFFLLGVVLPVVVLELSSCEDCEEYQIQDFELEIIASQACLAAVSLLCLSHNLRKYGIRKFLFVDKYSGHMLRFRHEYIQKISVSIFLF